MDPAVGDDVVHVPVQQDPGVQRDVQPAKRVGLFTGVQIDAAKQPLRLPRPLVGQLDVPGVLVDLVVHLGT